MQENNLKTSHINLENRTVGRRNRESVFHISGYELSNIQEYYDNLSKICKPNTRYCIIVRLCYNSDTEGILKNTNITEWKSLGEQISFYYEDLNVLYNKTVELKTGILERLEYLLELYSIKYSEVSYLQFIVFHIEYTEKTPKRSLNISSLGARKDLINQKQIKANSDLILLSNNINDLGVQLNKTSNQGVVDKITFINGESVNFYNNIKQYSNMVSPFTDDYNFYESNRKGKTLISVVKTTNKDLFSVNDINIYTKSGIKICSMRDENFENNKFKRTIGNVILDVNKGVLNKEIKQEFRYIQNKKISGYLGNLHYSDYKIGTMDLEAYVDKYNISKVYALGFYTKNSINTYYINKNLDSDQLIIKCLDDILKEKYNQYTFYVHNFARFDVTFILRIIVSLHENDPKTYNYDLLLRDNEIICLTISKTHYISATNTKKQIKKTYHIKIVDSYNILQNSLNDLCKTYKPSTVKTLFPYNFVNENTIFYKGNKPNISYYNNISEDDYESILNKNWSTEFETNKYLKNDLVSLFDILTIFNKHIWLQYGVHMTNSYTISSLSMEIYLKNYYDKNIPLINKRSVHNDIRNSYFGGITEVYKPFGINLYYYDVNSLYPYSALNDMPGLDCVYIENIDKNIKDCYNDLFGFYFCKIETDSKYIGLIPVRQKNGGVYMPEGYIEGWYFSEEIKFAFDNGYKVHVVHGYKFSRTKDVFAKYVNNFYKIKSETKDLVQRSTAKSLLNNLLGRFGLNINKPITKLLDHDELQEVLQTRRIVGDIKYIGDKRLVTYESYISPDICNQFDIDLIATQNIMLKNKKDLSHTAPNNVSVSISSAITAYSRVFMSKLKLDILNKNGEIYYTDTDSIVTDVPLNESIIGEEIGKFKLEHKIKEGYFLSNKTYCLVKHDDSVVIKVKGVNSKKLSLQDFKDMYVGKDVKTTRFESERNYNIGYTNINVLRDITLSSQSYKKRNKIFSKNIWVDTQPIKVSMWNKKSYSTYTYKNISNIYTFSFKKLMNILIIFLICLPYIILIYIGLLYENDIVNTGIYLDTYDIVDSNTNKTFIGNNHNSIKSYPYKFKTFEIINNRSNIVNKQIDKPNLGILDKVKQLHIQEIEKENQELQEIISKHKINELNNRIHCLDLLNDLKHTLESKKRS